jgi:hypothetical protein
MHLLLDKKEKQRKNTVKDSNPGVVKNEQKSSTLENR